MGEFDLQPPFGASPRAHRRFEDQPGAVDHLALELVFQIALLDRGQRHRR
jgi:hypothetical protein